MNNLKRYSFQNSQYLGFYAIDFWAENLKQAKEKCRDYLNMKRLPNNTAYWLNESWAR